MSMPAIVNGPAKGILAYNASMVGMLQSCLSNLNSGLATLPDLLEIIEDKECWRQFKFPDSDIFTWNAADFREFIEAPRPKGCQTPIHIVEQSLRKTPAWNIFMRLARGERGGANNPDGINQHSEVNRDKITVDLDPPATIPLPTAPPAPRKRDYTREAPTGTSVSYSLRRLSKKRPDLYEQVKAGDLTCHAAMVQGGFSESKITISKDPIRASRLLIKHFQGEDLKTLIRELVNWSEGGQDS